MTLTHVIDAKLDRAQRSKLGVEPDTTWPQSRLARLRTRTGEKGGVSAIGFALAAPILVGLLVPAADCGTAFSQQPEFQQTGKSIHEKNERSRPVPSLPQFTLQRTDEGLSLYLFANAEPCAHTSAVANLMAHSEVLP
jgi:hypothetical protein